MTASEGGITFEPSARAVVRTLAHTGSANPALASGSSGSIFLGVTTARGGRQSFEVYASADNGETFARDKTFPLPAGVSVDGQLAPRYVLDRHEHSHLLWTTESKDGHGLFAAERRWYERRLDVRSVRDRQAPGQTWIGFADLAVADDGTVLTSFLDERAHRGPSDDQSEVWFARAAGGRAFAANVRVATHTCSCCRTAVTTAGDGAVYVAFRGDFERDVRDMAVATSRDGGKTFGAPVRVARDGWSIHGCPESGPSLYTDGRRVWMTWFTLGPDARPRIELSWSDDHGRSWAAAREISASILDANRPHISRAQPSGVLVTFEGRSPAESGGLGHRRAWIVTVDGAGEAGAPVAATPANFDVHDPVALMPNATIVFVAATAGNNVVLVRGRARPTTQ